MSEGELYQLLRIRYPDKEWALLRHVANATGGGASRTADAVALNLWPSRGLELHGFEIKSARGDWLHELKNPAKASAVYPYCDRWWVVAADETIVKPGELPPTWGLLAGKGGKLSLRRAAESAPDVVAVQQAKDAGFKSGEERGKYERKHQLEEFQRLVTSVHDFEQASGVSITRYNAKPIGNAVKILLNHKKLADFASTMEYLKREVEGVLGALSQAMTEFASLEDADDPAEA